MKLCELLNVCKFADKKVVLFEAVDDDNEVKETEITKETIGKYYDFKVFDVISEIETLGKNLVCSYIKIFIVKGD
jgi:hypothetical protein